jgi:hypothetical protein
MYIIRLGFQVRPLVRYVVALCTMIVLSISTVVEPLHAQTGPPPTATPHYYYDRETAFLINYAIDPVFGGMYTALDEDGTLPGGFIEASVWGFPEGLIPYSSKSLYAQGTCIRYFIHEYQRVTVSGVGVEGINALLNGPPLTVEEDLLNYARSCADFVIDNMVILQGPRSDPWRDPADYDGTGPPPTQGDTAHPNRLYYWVYANREGTGNFFDDTLELGVLSAARAESIIPWSFAELALAMQAAGVGGAATYTTAAINWWDWHATLATDLPPYSGDPTQPGCAGNPPQDPNNCIPGIGRDVFYPALGFLLTAVTGNASYQATATTFANASLGTGNQPAVPDPPLEAFQDGAYASGLSRGVIFAHHAMGGGDLDDRNQWWDFGFSPGLNINGSFGDLTPAGNPEINAANMQIPFAHFRGRELLAGTQRALWYFYTFDLNPDIWYYNFANRPSQEDLGQAVLDYWNFTNEMLWDDTPGQAAWYENLGGGEFRQYKPCFAGGTDVPTADWLPPDIGDKVSTLNPDNSALVTVSGVVDRDWPYLSVNFRGSGIAEVQVVFTVDDGANYTVLPAVFDGTNYVATIPSQPDGTTVYYYAVARDNFGNSTSFPAGSETWNSAGITVAQDLNEMQTYSIGDPATETPTPTATATETPVPDATGTPVPTDPAAPTDPTDPAVMTAVAAAPLAEEPLDVDELLERVTELPHTGETPWWRNPALLVMGMGAGLAGMGVAVLVVRGIRRARQS